MARKATKERMVAWGSEEHAALLGLVKDLKAPDGWALADPTKWGPAASERFLAEMLRQAVAVLKSKPTPPENALPLWTPKLWRKEQLARERAEREMAEEEA